MRQPKCKSRNEDRISVLGLVFLNEPVVASGEPAELGHGLPDHAEDGFVEIVPAGDDAVHVVLLVLHGPEQDRVLQIHHLRHAAAGRAEKFALRGSRTIDDVVGGAEVLAEDFRLGGEVHPLAVRRQHAVLDVHARVER
jgi:hypothetical protein